MIHATARENNRTSRPRGRWLTKQGRRVCTADFWLRKLPIIGFARKYDLPSLLSDVIAGVTVGLTFIPTAMASALVAGLPSKHGLYTSLTSYFAYAVLGSRADVNVGTNIVTALFCKPFVDAFGPDIVFTYCFYIGCIITLIGVLNLGFLLDFISAPVMEGFLSGASIAAGAGQIPALLGFRPGGSNFLQYVENIVRNIHSARVFDSALGLICIGLLAIFSYCQKYGEKSIREESMVQQFGRGVLKYLSLSRTALVVILSTAFAANVSWDDEPLVHIAGEIEPGLPELRLPIFTTEHGNHTLSVTETMKVLSPGAPITLVIIVISSAASKAFANGETVDMGQEMTAVGVSNILGSLVQGVPSTGSVLMAIINKSAGVKTTISNIFAGFVIILSLCFFTNILKYFPTTTLAAIVLCSLPKVIRIHKYSAVLWNAKKSDLIPLHVTFWACLFAGLDAAMVAGIVSNICLILYEAARPKIQIEHKQVQVDGHSVLIVHVDRAVSYPAAEYVKQKVTKLSLSAPQNLRVILDGTHVNSVDATATQVLMSLMSEVNLRKQHICMWNCRKSVINTFVRFDPNCANYFRYDETLEEIVNAAVPITPDTIHDDIENNETSLIAKNSIHTTII